MEDIVGAEKVAGYTVYKEGRRYKCTVVSASENGLYVNIGGKKDGFIDKTEISLTGEYDPADFKDGDEFEVEILDARATPYIALSKKKIDLKLKEDEEAEKALSQGEFKMVATRVEKAGLSGKLGKYTVFVPASQIKIGFVKNLEEWLGKELRLVVMPPKETKAAEGAEEVEGEEVVEVVESDSKPKRRKSIVASQRMVLEAEKKEKEDEFWGSIEVNDIVEGKVKRFSDFGAFVSVNGFDCLAHISELSWSKVSDPSKILTLSETYAFVVLKKDREKNKISLGYKQLQKRPYEIAAEKYPVGSVIKGKILRVVSYGAFVSIEDEVGIDGLVHVSQISHNWIKDATEVLQPGQEVTAQILAIEDNKINLSMKALEPEPEVVEGAADASEEGGEERPKRNLSRFAKQPRSESGEGGERRERRPNSRKDDKSSEPRELISGSSSATIGDLLKGLDLDLSDDSSED